MAEPVLCYQQCTGKMSCGPCSLGCALSQDGLAWSAHAVRCRCGPAGCGRLPGANSTRAAASILTWLHSTARMLTEVRASLGPAQLLRPAPARKKGDHVLRARTVLRTFFFFLRRLQGPGKPPSPNFTAPPWPLTWVPASCLACMPCSSLLRHGAPCGVAQHSTCARQRHWLALQAFPLKPAHGPMK